jgi:hypothetical protein
MAKRSVSLEHAAESLRQRSEASKEYTVIAEAEKPTVSEGMAEGWIYGSEFDRALRLKADLVRNMRGKLLNKQFSAKPSATSRANVTAYPKITKLNSANPQLKKRGCG